MAASSLKDALGIETLKTMREVAMLFRGILTPACQKHNLTAQQFYVLAELANQPEQTATELADRAGILRTNFAAVCRKTEEKGLVERKRGSDDKRKVFLSLTDQGKALFEEIMGDIEAALYKGSAVMGEEDYASIRDGMLSLYKLLDASSR